MSGSRAWTVTALCAACFACLNGCSGKTERYTTGAGDGVPVQRPAAGPANSEPAPAQAVRHLLMVVELDQATHAARTLTRRSVDLPLPRRRGPQRQGPWRVDVLNAQGAALFSAPLEDAASVRGEFAEADGKLTGVTTQKRVAAVTLRLPLLHGASQVRLVSVNDGDRELGRVAYPEMAP